MSAIAAFLLAQAAPAVAAPPAMPAIEDAIAIIEANDAKLFWGFFEGCDPDAIAELLHPDFRMLHDLAGMAAASAEQMVANSKKQCARREPGGDAAGYKNRRLLVPGSRTISRLADWGMLEEAYHPFLEWRGEDIGWVQTGGGQYLHIWQWMPEEGRFRLLERLSLDHGPAPQYPPVLD